MTEDMAEALIGAAEIMAKQEFENDFTNKDVIIGLSGGINSMAVLCWLIESGMKPKTVHLYYAHFLEHSPDTFQFVADGIRYARKHFQNVKVKITKNSIIDFFKKQNYIPHPANSPCSLKLKIEPINLYASNNGILIDLVGYVKHEMKTRAEKQQKRLKKTNDLFQLKKIYPIGEFTDEWCFEIVKKHIGWHPAIYDIMDENGKRVFKHNNCLPCKNMYTEEFENVKKYYPDYYFTAIKLSYELSKYWGRDKDQFYMNFGRDLGQDSTCGNCVF